MKLYVKRFLVILIGVIAMLGITTFTSTKVDAAAKVSPISTVTTTTMYSKQMHLDWNYDIYLPAGYNPKSNKRYPVLYMSTDYMEIIEIY